MRGFIIRLSILLIPYIFLSFLLLDGSSNGGIGGGGYDLSGLVYGMMLFALVLIWLLVMLITYVNAKAETDKIRSLILLAIGFIALIAAWYITPRMF